MARIHHLTRREVLRTGIALAGVATAGCATRGDDREGDDSEPDTESSISTSTTAPTKTPEQISIDPFTLASHVDYWAWYPEDPALWSRSEEPYDFRADGRRWLAQPTEAGGIRCRVENGQAPGNAGFYLDIGPIGNVGDITIDSEISRSDGDGDQQLLVAIYFDRSEEGEYFEWEARDGREAFNDLGNDAEVLALFPSGGTYTLGPDIQLDLVPPVEEQLVTFGELKRGAIDGITPLTRAAVQISVVGSGEGNVEEAIVHDVEVVDSDPISADAWPMFSHDTYNTGHNPATAGPKDAVEARWVFETGGPVRSSPAGAHGAVYIGSDDGFVYGIDAVTGEQNWAYETGGPVVSSPAVLRYMVYVGSDDHNLYALVAETGEEVWAHETGGHVRSSPTVEPNARAKDYEDIVVVGSDDGSTYLLDAVTSDVLKVVRTDGPVVSTPIVVITYTGYWEFGVGSTDGQTHWWVPEPPNKSEGHIDRWDAAAPVQASLSAPLPQQEAVWFRATDEGTLFRMGVSPTVSWTFETGGKIRTTPVLAGDLVYVGSRDGNVYAVDTDSGDEVWRFETGGKVDSSPAVADGVLYVGSADHHVYALAAETGEELWAFETAGEVVSSPAVVDGTVYVGSNDGSVYALTEPSN